MKLFIKINFLGLLLVSMNSFAALQDIGVVKFSRGVVAAENKLQAESRLIAKGEKIYLKDTIQTAAKSFVILSFNDGSKITLRPESSFSINEYVNKKGGDAKASFKLNSGGARVVTGDIANNTTGKYQINTKDSNIKPKNSDFSLRICKENCQEGEERRDDIVARISSDVLEIDNSFLSIFELIIKEPLMILFTLISMYIISPELTGFVIIFIPISAIFISVVGKSLKRQSLKVQKEQGLFISLVDETLNGLKIVKIFNAENAFSRKFSESTNRLYKFSNSVINKKNLAGPLSEFLGICSIAIILWYGGMMVLKENSLDASTFLVYLGLAYNILTPAKSLSKASYKIRKAYGAAERVFQVLDDNRFIKSNEDDASLENFSTSIDFNNVSFRYDNEDVIKNLSLIIKKGETVALVGQSGSGKSTIANLISRFYDISEGEIRVDGKNIKEVNLKSLRKLIGLVTQDSILFNDSIKNNLLIGKEDANDQEIIQALKIANAWEFVKELPETIENNIGDSGNKLSGGQKQRLSIARAVLKNPPIMILDEATSALDSESENLVQMALDNVMKNKTSLVIAHRLSTIQKADNILVLDKGKVIESGKHKDLMDKGGIYTNLVRMQTI